MRERASLVRLLELQEMTMTKIRIFSTIYTLIPITAVLAACADPPRTSAITDASAISMSCMAGQERQCQMMNDMASGMGTMRDHMAYMQDMMRACAAGGNVCDHDKMKADMRTMHQRMQAMIGEMKGMNSMMGGGKMEGMMGGQGQAPMPTKPEPAPTYPQEEYSWYYAEQHKKP
jgi:hypothetical protein